MWEWSLSSAVADHQGQQFNIFTLNPKYWTTSPDPILRETLMCAGWCWLPLSLASVQFCAFITWWPVAPLCDQSVQCCQYQWDGLPVGQASVHCIHTHVTLLLEEPARVIQASWIFQFVRYHTVFEVPGFSTGSTPPMLLLYWALRWGCLIITLFSSAYDQCLCEWFAAVAMRRNCDNTVVVPSYNVDTGGVLVKSIISCTTRLFLQFLWCDEWTFIGTIYT